MPALFVSALSRQPVVENVRSRMFVIADMTAKRYAVKSGAGMNIHTASSE